MTLQERIALLVRLGNYMRTDPAWQAMVEAASSENAWFVPAFTRIASDNIVEAFLDEEKLTNWCAAYAIPDVNSSKTVGIVMAGNIPMVGFHDFLCGFISGHKMLLKLSSKDSLLMKHLVKTMAGWDGEMNELVNFAEQLKGCDAYIATGSNNSSRYFEYYFRNYPSIIRKNRTSVAVLTVNETNEDLLKLADDILLYFGLGCRNVSKLYVPKGYDFKPMLDAMDKYKWLGDHAKFKNNYDYNLSLHLLNGQYYMTNGTVLLIEKDMLFSPISQVNFEFYDSPPTNLQACCADDLQCIIGEGYTPFGQAQQPALSDYADHVDTMDFFTKLA